MALPNFLCIGAQKAGTTPLFHLLRQHPDVFIYPQKETHFFYTFRHDMPEHLYEWAFFAGYAGQRMLGEISPEYIRTPGAARAVRARLGQIKIIICLRDPLARAFSHYLHCLRNAEDNRSFVEACRSDAELPLWANSHNDVSRAYVRGSWYAYQIEEWQREFGAENLLFCILERDLASERGKAQLLDRLFAFLGVSAASVQIKFSVANVSAPAPEIFFPRTRGVIRSGRQGVTAVEPGDIVVQVEGRGRIVRRPTPAFRSYLEKMAREMTPSLSPDMQQSLRRTYFTGVAERTSELVGEDLVAIWGLPPAQAAVAKLP